MEQTINRDWRFLLGDEPNSWKKDYDDSDWRTVTLPHDWAVEGEFSTRNSSGTGYLPGGTGWYRGRFDLPQTLRGKRVLLHFDGVYKNGSVWCNSYYLGARPNGYIGYSYDITHCLSWDGSENVIAVRVEHEDIADSRWFTGSGITRGVSLHICDTLHLTEDGIIFETPTATNELATIRAHCTVANAGEEDADVTVNCRLLEGKGRTAWEASCVATVPAGAGTTVTLAGQIASPALWSPDSPNRYTLQVGVSRDGATTDERTLLVGLRQLSFDPNNGFAVNGRGEKLRGVCLHHDAGCLGAAVRKAVWHRRLELLKEMGCNAIRTSHNPHMPELLELCDELGFLVIDEAFDEWEGCKNKWSTGHNIYPPKYEGYYKDFPQWGEADLRALVRRDRNHPCVMMWSIGNEVDYPNDPYCHPLFKDATGNNDASKPAEERIYNPARPSMERLAFITERLAQVVREEDVTRPVTAALAFPELSSHLGCVEPLDVVGYNYKEELYEQDHLRFPDKPLLGSENSKDYEAWQSVVANDYIAGQFLWTGIDFLGEAHGWPIHGSGAGLLTLAGFPKGEYWFRRSLWRRDPVATLTTARCDSDRFERRWGYRVGEAVTIRCCTNQPQAELFIGSRSLGIKPLSKETGDIRWVVPFAEEQLRVQTDAVADTMEVPGQPATLAMTLWRHELLANGEDVAQVEVTLLDNQGRATGGEELLEVTVEGATLLGIENGNLADNTSYSAHYRRTYQGQLLIYLLAGTSSGTAQLTVVGEAVGKHTLEVAFG